VANIYQRITQSIDYTGMRFIALWPPSLTNIVKFQSAVSDSKTSDLLDLLNSLNSKSDARKHGETVIIVFQLFPVKSGLRQDVKTHGTYARQ